LSGAIVTNEKASILYNRKEENLMPSKKNIIVGAAQVWIGPSLDPVNDAASVTALRATGTTKQGVTMAGAANWRDVGYTQDGLEVSTDPSWGEVEVDQLLDSAKIFKDGMSLSITTTFAEGTLQNMLVAWGQADSYITSTANELEIEIDGGGLGDAPMERGLVAIGNAPEKAGSNAYGERTYFAYRVLSVEGAAHSLARADATTIPVTFRALPADDGKYGTVRDRFNV
jgi:hypothetical protein